MRIAIVGGAGSFGSALARRLSSVDNYELVLGSRDAARAQASAIELGLNVEGASNADAVADADFVVLAVSAESALETVSGLSVLLGTTPLLSVATLLSAAPEGMRPDPAGLSLAERIQELVEGPVVAGLHSIAARNLAQAPPTEDALVCGDDAEAKQIALSLAANIVAGRALDAGPLANARTLEGLAAVVVNLNRRYKAHAGVSITGISRP